MIAANVFVCTKGYRLGSVVLKDNKHENSSFGYLYDHNMMDCMH